jgi:hypothetical protein
MIGELARKLGDICQYRGLNAGYLNRAVSMPSRDRCNCLGFFIERMAAPNDMHVRAQENQVMSINFSRNSISEF